MEHIETRQQVHMTLWRLLMKSNLMIKEAHGPHGERAQLGNLMRF